MAPRFYTDRLQRSGYKFLTKRQEQAFIRRDIRGLANPFSAQTSAVAFGTFAIGLTMVLALIISIFKPSPDRGVDAIITTQSGGMYVMYGDRLHPVTNLASARLIVGSAENSQVVKDSSIKDIPRGPLMGIPSAPNSLAAHSEDPATWTLCDRRDPKADLSLTTAGKFQTTLIAGKDMLDENAHRMEDHEALLVRSVSAPDVLWLVFKGHRAEIGRQDFATHAALGLTPAKINSAILLSGGLVDAIDVLPTLTIPYIADRGKVSARVPEHAIGDIVTIGDAKGERENYVVVNDGVQRVTPLVASLLINTGSRQTVEVDPEKVTSLPQVQVIDLNRYPDRIPEIKDPATVCFSWSRGRDDQSAKTSVIIGDTLPVTDEARSYTLDLLKPKEGVVQAEKSIMKPGEGWYVRITGSNSSSQSAEQLIYIDDAGTRYFISPDKDGKYDTVVDALGLHWQVPMPIPWAIAKLYVEGATLSFEEARVFHAYIPPNKDGTPAPPKDGTLTPPQ